LVKNFGPIKTRLGDVSPLDRSRDGLIGPAKSIDGMTFGPFRPMIVKRKRRG